MSRIRDLQSHTFLNLPIHDMHLARWGKVLYVLIGSLLNLLQQQTLSSVSDDLA